MSETIVHKDMGESYNEQLSNIQKEIDYYKKLSLTTPKGILFLSERLHAWYLQISGKMLKNSMKEDMGKQSKFNVDINSINPLQRKDYDSNNKKCTPFWDRGIDWNRYSILVEEREIHLRYCMEELGLTNADKKQNKKLR